MSRVKAIVSRWSFLSLKGKKRSKNNNTKQYLLFSNSDPVLKLDISYYSLSLIFLAHCCVLISLVSVKPLKNLCQVSRPQIAKPRIPLWVNGREEILLKDTKYRAFYLLYYCMRNFCNLIGSEQWYFSYMWKLQPFCG